ncbi:MAG: fimbrillin family protein [Alistipes putredinis]|nr:MAG: fimbrillin family protein [Alistipes putredinis]
MKRTVYTLRWPRAGMWLPVSLLIGGLLASCGKKEAEDAASLPDGKYPLQLTAEVAQPQTCAGGKNAWTGGEEIRVSLEGVFGNKTYVLDASGNASPKDADNAFYWKNTDEARVSAWTPDIESETDISDQSGGYAAFDVLYASAIGRYDQAINLRFIHRMTKNRSNSQSWRRHYGRGVGGCDRHHFRRPANALNRRLGITG